VAGAYRQAFAQNRVDGVYEVVEVAFERLLIAELSRPVAPRCPVYAQSPAFRTPRGRIHPEVVSRGQPRERRQEVR
jgi:hypothetical protein